MNANERDLDIENRFNFHPADQPTGEVHAELRDGCKELAYEIRRLVPEGREQSLALTNLEQAMMWGNAGIARISDLGMRPTGESSEGAATAPAGQEGAAPDEAAGAGASAEGAGADAAAAGTETETGAGEAAAAQ